MKYIILLLAVLSSSCSGGAGNPQNVKHNVADAVIVDYGNGVYYFKATGATLGNNLSSFLSAKSCDIQALVGDGTGSYGSDVGYFLVCTEKSK